MPISLRPYQIEAADAVAQCHADGTLRPAVILPTGTGKTTVIAELARRQTNTRSVTLAHRTEIVDQIADRLKAHGIGSVGVVAGSRNQFGAQHIVGMVQTLRNDKRLSRLAGTAGLVIVDECHHATADSYQKVLAALGCFESTPAVGFTATLSRGDKARLGDTWDTVAYSKNIRWAISAGYLCPIRGKAVVMPHMDLSKVRTSGGDYQDGELGEVIAAESAAIVRAWKRHGEGRKTMAFVPSVEAAEELCDAFGQAGVPAAFVIGATGIRERQAIYESFAAGQIQVLVSVSVLTEGFDLPAVECILMARPTKLQHVYVQAAGRGLRPSPGKVDCLLLDVVGVSQIHSLVGANTLDEDVAYERVAIDGEELPADVEQQLEAEDAITQKRTQIELDDIDLFKMSDRIWLHTRGGVRFIPAGDWLVFLWPVIYQGQDLYSVGVMNAKGRDRRGGFVHITHLGDGMGLGTLDSAAVWDLEGAKAVAEGQALNRGATLANKDASWRARKKPSDKMVNYALRLNIPHPDSLTTAALSDQIDIVLASSKLDI